MKTKREGSSKQHNLCIVKDERGHVIDQEIQIMPIYGQSEIQEFYEKVFQAPGITQRIRCPNCHEKYLFHYAKLIDSRTKGLRVACVNWPCCSQSASPKKASQLSADPI